MNSRMPRIIATLAVAALAVSGCSDDSTAPPADTQFNAGLIEGEIGNADFEITLQATESGGHHAQGPFVMRGTNLHYDSTLTALVVDVTLRNDGDVSHAEPVGLTFVDFIPDSVALINPDNGIHGEGAAVTFAFANDDNRWTPGETTLPRTLQFDVAAGTAVGFAARLDIGEPIDGGTIAGRVWNDANQDGVMDDGEHGVRGVCINLRSISDEDSTIQDSEHSTRSNDDGHYAFHHLPAGVYVVGHDAENPTTPVELTVLLTETGSDVSDFLDANFGILDDNTPPPLDVDLFVEVNGHYATDPDRLVAQGIEVSSCERDKDEGSDDSGVVLAGDDDGDDGDDDEDCNRGKLRGPVTEMDAANHTFAVMGTWVTASSLTFPTDLQVGDRVDVRVHHGEGDALLVDVVKPWHNDQFEQVHGRIDSVERDGDAVYLTVLGTRVVVSPHHDDVR